MSTMTPNDATANAIPSAVARRRRRWRLLIALALLGVAAFVVARLLAVNRLATGPSHATAPLAEFIDSVGVNTHVSYYPTGYGNPGAWLPLLRELGVRHLRDNLVLADPRDLSVLHELAADGIRTTLIVPESVPVEQAVTTVTGALRSAVEALEGPNETDLRPNWQVGLHVEMPALRRAVEHSSEPKLPLIGPSFVHKIDYEAVHGLAPTWDVENLHSYPGGHQPGTNLARILGAARDIDPSAPVVVTEDGYHNALNASVEQPPVPEQVAATYLPRLLLEHFTDGIARTYIYELLDETPDPGLTNPEAHFGLVRADMTPKPAFYAIRNLLRIANASPGGGRTIKAKVSGNDVRSLTLVRPDRSRVLFLWRDLEIWNPDAHQSLEATPEPVTVSLSRRAAHVMVYDPTTSDSPLAQHPGVRNVPLSLGADVIAVNYG